MLDRWVLVFVLGMLVVWPNVSGFASRVAAMLVVPVARSGGPNGHGLFNHAVCHLVDGWDGGWVWYCVGVGQ